MSFKITNLLYFLLFFYNGFLFGVKINTLDTIKEKKSIGFFGEDNGKPIEINLKKNKKELDDFSSAASTTGANSSLLQDNRLNEQRTLLRSFIPAYPAPLVDIGTEEGFIRHLSYHGLFSVGQIAVLISSLLIAFNYKDSKEKFAFQEHIKAGGNELSFKKMTNHKHLSLKQHLEEHKYALLLYPLFSLARYYSYKLPKKSWNV